MIFLDTINVMKINVKLCMMVLCHVELYLFIPLSVTLITFQDYSSTKELELRILCSCLIKLKLCRFVIISTISWIHYFFVLLLHTVKGDNWHFLIEGNNCNVGLFLDKVKVRSLNFAQPYHYLGLPVHTRFDDCDLVSMSQMCQKQTAKCVFKNHV